MITGICSSLYPPMLPNCWQFPKQEMETTHIPVETHSVHPPSQGCTTLTGINSVSLDLGMTGQVGQATSSSASHFFYQPPFHGFVFMAYSLLLNFSLVCTGNGFPLASQPLSGLPGAPGGFVPLVFPTLPAHPHVPSMGSGRTFPLLAAGSVQPVISLLCLQPRSSAANPPPPSSTGPSWLPLGAYPALERGFHLICLVCALCIYLRCTEHSHRPNWSLFVHWDEGRAYRPVLKRWISSCPTEAICSAYRHQGREHEIIHANPHSIWDVAEIARVPASEICCAATWSGPCTFCPILPVGFFWRWFWGRHS